MELSEKLVQLGFTKNQAAVYSALIELGQCKAGDIIKKTGLHRNIVYEALDDLVARKLAFKTSKGGVALFQLSDAATLVHDAEQQMSTAKEISDEINKLRTKSTHEIKLYEGFDGLKQYRNAAYTEMEPRDGKKADELLLLGASIQATEDLSGVFWQKNHEQRVKKGIPARLLFSTESRKHAEDRAALPLTDVRYLPQSIKDPASVDIWKDQVAFMMFEVEPFIVSIKNQQLADSFRSYFETLWNQDVFVTTGLQEVYGLFYRKMEAMKKGEEYVVLGGNYGKGGREQTIEFFKGYHTARYERGVHVKLLAYSDDRELIRHELTQCGDEKMKTSEARFLGSEFKSPMQINIYPDSIILVHWADEAVAVEIKRDDIRDAMQLYFDALWNQDTHLVTGRKEMEKLLRRKLDEMPDGTEYYVYGGQYGEKNQQHIFDYYVKYHLERVQRKVKLNIVGFKNTKTLLADEMKSADKNLKLTNIRFLEQETSTPLFVHIYPDSAVIGMWDYDEAMAIETTRKAAREMLKKYFDMNWASAKP
ncbi:MAG: helix-turn-helix domain-containing protein [Candidatus Kerfeldbacteria bacterium]